MAEDLRVMRTKRSIKVAFAKLVNENGFANVTVKGIAERAIINRQTFYNYYQDKYDLTEQLNDEYLAVFKRIIAKRLANIQPENHHLPLLSDLYQSDEFSVLWDSREILRALLSIQYDQNSFSARLQKLFIQMLQKQLPVKLSDIDITIIGSFYIDMVTFVVKNNVKLTDQELAKLRKILNLIVQ